MESAGLGAVPSKRSKRTPAALIREAALLDREALVFGYAIRNALGTAIVLGIGLATGHTDWGLIAAVGAIVVGFGDIGLTTRRRASTMLICTAAAMVSAVIGALAANTDVSAVTAMAIWGGVAGLLVALGTAESMTAKLAALSLILVGDDATSLGAALEIALAVGVGGLVQTAMAFACSTRTVVGSCTSVGHGQRVAALRNAAAINTTIGRHAIRYALALSVAVLFYRHAPVDHGLWVPLTVLFVLTPDPRETRFKTFERIVGTLVGVSAITVLVAVIEPSDFAMAIFACLFLVPTYAFFRANYAVFSASIAATVVLLVAITGLPEADAAWYRSVDTLIGGAIALAAVSLIPLPKNRAPDG